MTIQFYKNVSESNALDKSITPLVLVTGTLRDESSIINPVVHVTDLENYIADINYAYITEFHRFYFVNNIDYIRNNLWRLSMHVDVLTTYKSEIRDNYAIIERNEKEYDLKLNDGLFQTQQNPRITQYPFPSGFNTWNFVLAVAGN